MAPRTGIKKYLSAYAAVLAAVFLILSLLDKGGDYAVERRLWQINRKYTHALKDPRTASPYVFDEIVRAYRKVIAQYSQAESIPGVYVLLARIYIVRSDFENARETLSEVIKLHPDYGELSAEAVSLMAKTYELEGDWPKARELYQKVVEQYPRTNIGLTVPLYIAEYHQRRNDFRNAMSSYAKAIDFYREMAAANPDSRLEFESLRYLANCYVAQNRWQEAVETLKQILLKYPSDEYLDRPKADLIIKTINTIVTTQIRDYDMAIAVYREFMQKHPDHSLNDTFSSLVEHFEKLKRTDTMSKDKP